jgi:hypothetical protein
MAIAGVFITWGFANITLTNQQSNATLLYRSGESSEAMASPTVSVSMAPGDGISIQQAVLSIAAAAPIYFIVGKNATQPTSPPANVIGGAAARYYDPSFGPIDIVVNAGDKMAWNLA